MKKLTAVVFLSARFDLALRLQVLCCPSCHVMSFFFFLRSFLPLSSFFFLQAGVRHWLDVADVLFRYIGMLRREGPQEWVFQEIRDVANIQYRRES